MRKPHKMVAVLGYIARSGRWNLKSKAKFMFKLLTRKINYLRVFIVNPWTQTECSSPFYYDKDYKLYDLDEWNPKFFEALKELADLAGDFWMALTIDLFDHCGTNKKLRKRNPWYNNCNGVDGFYDTRPHAMFYQRKLIAKVVETIGFHAYRKNKLGIKVRGKSHIYSLGNELYTHRGLGTHYHWIGRDWALPHALYLRKLGYKNKIFFSAHHWAGHAIWGYLSPEGEEYGSTFGFNDLVHQLHGMSYEQWVDEKVGTFSMGRNVGISDDGTNIKDLADKGICINGNRYCSARIELVCDTVKYAAETCEKRRRRRNRRYRKLHHIEMLPRSISEDYQSLNNLNRHRDLNVWRAIGRRVYGQNWTRRCPRYLKRRYGIEAEG